MAATLACLEIDLGLGSRRPAAFTVYVQTREFDDGRAADDGGSRTTLEFALPPDARPTDLARKEGRRCWILQVADAAGDSPASAEPESFVVPVY